MKHDVAKQAANEMALKDVDKAIFDQRISLAVVTVFDKQGGIDILARSSIWPGNVCAPRILCEGNVLSFSTRIGRLGKERKNARAQC